jgi:hypothetical protein
MYLGVNSFTPRSPCLRGKSVQYLLNRRLGVVGVSPFEPFREEKKCDSRAWNRNVHLVCKLMTVQLRYSTARGVSLQIKGKTGMLAEIFCGTLSTAFLSCTAFGSNPSVSSTEPKSKSLIYSTHYLFRFTSGIMLQCAQNF